MPLYHADLSLVSLTRDAGEAEERQECRYAATVRRDGEDVHITYEEAIDDTDTLTRVALTLSPGQVCYGRTGEYTVDICYRQGEHCLVNYQTPFGEVPFTIYTRLADWQMDEKEGAVSLRYQISANGEAVSETELSMRLRLSPWSGV